MKKATYKNFIKDRFNDENSKECEDKKTDESEQHVKDIGSLDNYFAKASMEKPLEFDLVFDDIKKLDSFLKNKIVAIYLTGYFYEPSGILKCIGKYVGLKYLHKKADLSFIDFLDAVENIDKNVSFSQDTYAVDRIVTMLKNAGYEVEGVGRSGFKARNSFVVLLPKIKVKVHIVKIGDFINHKEVGKEKIWYCGKSLIDINDQEKREEVLKIIEEARAEEKDEETKEFIKEFKKNGDGIFAVINTGGYEKFQSIPERFKVIASIRIANTQDHRRNLTHTYANAVIDTEAIKGKKVIRIKVPNNIKGLIIGKGGSNIKRITKELGLSYIKII